MENEQKDPITIVMAWVGGILSIILLIKEIIN